MPDRWISRVAIRRRAKWSGTCALAAALILATSNPAFAGGRYRYHGGHGHHYSHSYHGFGYAAAVLLGLGVLALALSRPSPGYYYRSYDRYPAYYYRYPRRVYVQPPVRYVRPRVAAVAPPARPARPQLPQGCLMIREYQTRISVGGREVDAYGDACLLADGSWRRGTPKLVPE